MTDAVSSVQSLLEVLQSDCGTVAVGEAGKWRPQRGRVKEL